MIFGIRTPDFLAHSVAAEVMSGLTRAKIVNAVRSLDKNKKGPENADK